MLVLSTQGLSDDERSRLRAAAPEADFVAAEGDEIAKHVPDAEVILAGRFDAEILRSAPKLRWVQAGSAGIEGYLFPELLASDVILTSASGVFNKPIAEHLLAMMLAFTRRLPQFRDRQLRTEWDRVPWPDELEGKTLGVVGLGEIGTELARKVLPLGMRVIGVRRTPPVRPPDGVEWVRGMESILDLAAEADHLVDTLPNTPATRGMLSRDVFAAMKPTAYVYNIGRGVTIDQDALIDALSGGRLAGAGLDVTSPEPLPKESPLWRMENVILTPHVSGHSPRTRERLIAFVADNLGRYVAGEPLRSVVDKSAGY